MNLPNRGDIIVFTNKHPYHSDRAGEVFGIVIKTNGYIVVVERSEGDTDRILWCNTNGDVNPFYSVAQKKIISNLSLKRLDSTSPIV